MNNLHMLTAKDNGGGEGSGVAVCVFDSKVFIVFYIFLLFLFSFFSSTLN